MVYLNLDATQYNFIYFFKMLLTSGFLSNLLTVLSTSLANELIVGVREHFFPLAMVLRAVPRSLLK